MSFMRRSLLKGAAGLAAVVGLDALSTGFATAEELSDGDATTLERTLLAGTPGRGGYTPITIGAGEPYVLRMDLAPSATRRFDDRRVVASFAQLTDIHVMDHQSPARFEFLDPFGSLSIPAVADLSSAYRPHELLSAQ